MTEQEEFELRIALHGWGHPVDEWPVSAVVDLGRFYITPDGDHFAGWFQRLFYVAPQRNFAIPTIDEFCRGACARDTQTFFIDGPIAGRFLRLRREAWSVDVPELYPHSRAYRTVTYHRVGIRFPTGAMGEVASCRRTGFEPEPYELVQTAWMLYGARLALENGR